MRFSLRSLLIATAIVAAFMGGRASLLPLIEQHRQEKEAIEKQLESSAKIQPAIDRFKQSHAERLARLEAENDEIRDQLRKAKAKLDSRFNGQLAFPANTERAMIGDAFSAAERQ